MNKKQLACEAVLYYYSHPEEFEMGKLRMLANQNNNSGKFIKLDSSERFHKKEVLSKKFGVSTGYITKYFSLHKQDKEGFDFVHQTGQDIPRDREKGVYLISSGSLPTTNVGHPIKIGKTDNLVSRLASIQTGSWLKLSVMRWMPTENYDLFEKHLHKQFRDKRLNGEWFELKRQDLFLISRMYSNIDKIIPLG